MNNGLGRRSRFGAWCGAGLLGVLAAGCMQGTGDDTSVESTVEQVSSTAISRHYYGYVNPRTGEVKFSEQPFEFDESRFGAAGHLVPGQFGEVPIVQDGVNGTNPPNTFELQGVGVAIDDAGQSGGQSQCPGSNFILDIQLRHFFDKATFEDVFVEFTKIEPGVTHYPYDTDGVPGGLPLDNSIGVYSYGTLSDANSNEATRTWKFERCTSEPFVFEFALLGSCVPEAGETALSACRDNPGYKRIAAANGVSCFRDLNAAKCWGSNANNVLTGPGDDAGEPVSVTKEVTEELIVIQSFDAGARHTCARMGDNKVRCWGDNTHGQLGNGTTVDSAEGVEVITATGAVLNGIIDVASGEGHSCALTSKGRVKCWGFNGYGQLGTGDEGSSLSPRDVRAVSGTGLLGGVTDITANEHMTCGLLGTGEVVCWGFNRQGQLGNGTRNDSTRPVYVLDSTGMANLTGVVGVSMGVQHACAVTSTGDAYCWGDNKFTQLGDGTSSDRSMATQVLGVGGVGTLADVVEIDAGRYHTCARLGSGEARCWGVGNRLGQGSSSNQSTPVAVKNPNNTANLSGLTSIRTQVDSTCALNTNNQVLCWGANASGQLGSGTTSTQLLPVAVRDTLGDPQLEGVERIAVGENFGCALDNQDRVFCWGANANGQLGTGDFMSSLIPVATTLDLSTFKSPLLGLTNVVAGNNHACGLLDTGNVKCWGDNSYSQLGTGDEEPGIYPRDVVGVGGSGKLAGVRQLSANGLSTCALLDSGEVACWGANRKGQLGNGTRNDSTIPVFVQLGAGNLSDIVQINAGELHFCAVSSFSEVYCWGFNKFAQLGDGTTTDRLFPVNVRGPGGAGILSGAVYVAVGAEHSCALIDTGNVYCWGRSGRLGTGAGGTSAVPVQVAGVGGVGTLGGVVGVSSFGTHTHALLGDGTLVGWGINSSGQIGDGTTSNRLAPVKVRNETGTSDLLDVREVSSGSQHSCAYMADRTVKCWGAGGVGQLGDGQFSSSFLPVDVNL